VNAIAMTTANKSRLKEGNAPVISIIIARLVDRRKNFQSFFTFAPLIRDISEESALDQVGQN
jgi:hypothetical protein